MPNKTKKYPFLGLEIGRIGWWGALVAFLTIPVAAIPYMLWFFVKNELPLSKNPEHWAQFGDYLAGTAGPIIGFASIMVLIATLYSQQSELSEQRKQASRQAFEQTFFNWLNSYREAIDRLRFPSADAEDLSGLLALGAIINGLNEEDRTACIVLMYSIIDQKRNGAQEAKAETKAIIVSDISDWWKRTYDHHEPQLGGLIRTLFTLVRWVDRHPDLLPMERWDYVAILRARLSSPELSMLFFNGYSLDGLPFTEYVDKYALLDNLPRTTHELVRLATISDTEPFSENAFHSDYARTALGLSANIKHPPERR